MVFTWTAVARSLSINVVLSMYLDNGAVGTCLDVVKGVISVRVEVDNVLVE